MSTGQRDLLKRSPLLVLLVQSQFPLPSYMLFSLLETTITQVQRKMRSVQVVLSDPRVAFLACPTFVERNSLQGNRLKVLSFSSLCTI